MKEALRPESNAKGKVVLPFIFNQLYRSLGSIILVSRPFSPKLYRVLWGVAIGIEFEQGRQGYWMLPWWEYILKCGKLAIMLTLIYFFIQAIWHALFWRSHKINRRYPSAM